MLSNMQGVGVGDQEASVAAATYTHLLRNATGLLAYLLVCLFVVGRRG
tara:strand:+ start:157 stop:300 length:144 start_codon:yes stop_codon:yes gene_type:complete